MALKIKEIGYRSEHINIDSLDKLNVFINSLDVLFDINNEIWVVESSGKKCWRCRLYLSPKGEDFIEMSFSDDDHILDKISNKNIKYIRFKINRAKLEIDFSNIINEIEPFNYASEIISKFNKEIKRVKEDLEILKLNGISLDIRINDGYDFHDFDVSYDRTKDVVDYYYQFYK